MTYFKRLFAALICLLLFTAGMCEDERESYYSKTLNIPNIIDIENQINYQINDLIYFNAQFSRFLPEPGYTNPLDIFINNKSDRYYIGYSLEKKTAYNNWSYLDLNGNIIADKGEITNISAICVLNNTTNNYEFRGGIKLLETGNYRLNISTYLTPSNNFNYYNDKIIQIQIYTTVVDYVNSNTYEFTVN